jgi:hypothetical protein
MVDLRQGRRWHWRALGSVLAMVAWSTSQAAAQTVEISPFGGYRVGGSIAEVNGGTVDDDDGGPSAGVIVDVDFGSTTAGLKLEGVFSRERTNLEVRYGAFDPTTQVRVEVDQLLIGGVQDFDYGRVRPFLSGLLGITRYGVAGDNEVRFTVGVGAGAKFFATRNLGLRLDARGYMTIVDLGGAGVCGGFGCAIAFNVSPVFQGDFTAGVIVAF